MKDVYFILFPKEKSKLERWVRACSREGFTADHVTRHTFICSRHFVGGKGPTIDHPDPIPGNFCDAQVRSELERSDALVCFYKWQYHKFRCRS